MVLVIIVILFQLYAPAHFFLLLSNLLYLFQQQKTLHTVIFYNVLQKIKADLQPWVYLSRGFPTVLHTLQHIYCKS